LRVALEDILWLLLCLQLLRQESESYVSMLWLVLHTVSFLACCLPLLMLTPATDETVNNGRCRGRV
jgi:hypothetical protein